MSMGSAEEEAKFIKIFACVLLPVILFTGWLITELPEKQLAWAEKIYCLSVEDGVMHFESGEKNAPTYSSDQYKIKVIKRLSADQFSVNFIALDDPRIESAVISISVEELHQLAEWFDITHLRHVGEAKKPAY